MPAPAPITRKNRFHVFFSRDDDPFFHKLPPFFFRVPEPLKYFD